MRGSHLNLKSSLWPQCGERIEGTAYGARLGKGAIGVVQARHDAVWTQELVVEK